MGNRNSNRPSESYNKGRSRIDRVKGNQLGYSTSDDLTKRTDNSEAKAHVTDQLRKDGKLNSCESKESNGPKVEAEIHAVDLVEEMKENHHNKHFDSLGPQHFTDRSSLGEYTNEAANSSMEGQEREGWKSESEDEPCYDTPQDDTPPVSYNLKLICSTDDTKSRNTKIVIPHTPRTALDVKLCVENEFSIPACCQCMTFESHKLRNQDSIEELRIWEGDTLTVHYTSEAMVEDIRKIIQAMKAMRHFLRRRSTRKQLTIGCENDTEFINEIDGEAIKMMVSTYFLPLDDEYCKANFMYFASNNGLLLINQLHKELLRYPLKNCTIEMYNLEGAILKVQWHTTTALPVRKLIHFFHRSQLDALMKSLVRVPIPADSEIQGPRNESNVIIGEVLFQALGTIANLAEVPKCRMAIASRRDVMDQLLATLTCPSFDYIPTLVAVCAFLCLSFRYLQSLCYAQLLNSSASKIPLHLKYTMHKAITSVLQTTTILQIHNQENDLDCIWTTISPFMKLVYFPKQNSQWSFCGPEPNSDEEIKCLQELEDLCTEIGVFSLQSILLSDGNRQVMIDESLVDYIVCLPWHLSPETKAHGRACRLRKYLSVKMQLQPPSLVNLTKAKLAATHCGLDIVLKTTGLHDIVGY